jgi:hypothetical protein
MTEDWIGEAEESLRREILRRGEEITHLANKLEITERRLKAALGTIDTLAKCIQEMRDAGNKS